MVEPKVRLSLFIQGANMLSSQECDENPKKNYNVESITLEHKNKKGHFNRETVIVKTRKSRLIRQSINISREAYDYMTAPDQPPTESLARKLYIAKVIGKDSNGKPKKVTTETTVWAHNFTLEKRLDWHMAQIAESLGAKGYKFEILDD